MTPLHTKSTSCLEEDQRDVLPANYVTPVNERDAHPCEMCKFILMLFSAGKLRFISGNLDNPDHSPTLQAFHHRREAAYCN